MSTRDSLAEEPESVDAILASDRFIEQLRTSVPSEPVDRTDAALATALVAWRDEVRQESLTPPPRVEDIDVRALRQPHRIARRSVAVAGVLLALSSAAATAMDSDPLKPVRFIVDIGVQVGEGIGNPDNDSSTDEIPPETISGEDSPVDSFDADGPGSATDPFAATPDPQRPEQSIPVDPPDASTPPEGESPTDSDDEAGSGGEEPGVEDPGAEEPGSQEPDGEEPDVDGPDPQEPGTEDPGTGEPDAEEPGSEEPATEEPGTEDPDSQEPGASDPTTDPTTEPTEPSESPTGEEPQEQQDSGGESTGEPTLQDESEPEGESTAEPSESPSPTPTMTTATPTEP